MLSVRGPSSEERKADAERWPFSYKYYMCGCILTPFLLSSSWYSSLSNSGFSLRWIPAADSIAANLAVSLYAMSSKPVEQLTSAFLTTSEKYTLRSGSVPSFGKFPTPTLPLREKEELFYTPLRLKTELSAQGRSSQWNSYLFVEQFSAPLLERGRFNEINPLWDSPRLNKVRFSFFLLSLSLSVECHLHSQKLSFNGIPKLR